MISIRINTSPRHVIDISRFTLQSEGNLAIEIKRLNIKPGKGLLHLDLGGAPQAIEEFCAHLRESFPHVELVTLRILSRDVAKPEDPGASGSTMGGEPITPGPRGPGRS